MIQLLPLILSGGSGTRMWPVSRESYPKQFHRFFGNQTLFEGAVARAAAVPQVQSIAIICNDQHRFMAAEQAHHATDLPTQIFLEPHGRNTAPAIAAVAQHYSDHGQNPILLVLSADHYLPDTHAFVHKVKQAVLLAEQGYLVTFGIQPNAPETGYGYIEAGEQIASVAGAYKVARFVEKPSAIAAAELIKNPKYAWNSGMFVMRASRYLTELAKYAPQVTHAMKTAVAQESITYDFVRFGKSGFEACPSISVDYAVFEHSDQVATLTYGGQWSDMGTWASVAAHANTQGENGLGVHGSVVSLSAHNNYIYANKPVAIVGVSNMSIIDTPDALLVVSHDCAQQVKDAVGQVSKTHQNLLTTHRKVHRPWGWYDSIEQTDDGKGYQVKHIHVDVGQSLSLQSHTHRAEHWLVVAGTATVTVAPIGIDTNNDAAIQPYRFQLTKGQHIDIAIGEVHRLENHGTTAVELIEIQFGNYLGEDDIVRFADTYARI